MNTLNKLAVNGVLFAFLLLSLTVSARAQIAMGANHGFQEGAQECPTRHKLPGANTPRRLLFWNEIALKANARDHARMAPLSPDQPGPVRTARAFAIVHIAIFDAFNAIVGGYESYTGLELDSLDAEFRWDRHRASVDAAIAQAAGDTLIALYPSQAEDIEAVQRIDLRTIPNGPAKKAGIKIGRRAAGLILAIRNNDGSQHSEPLYDVPGGYILKPGFGKWRQDPISLIPIALGASWNRVQPFVILSADQFRSVDPPALTSAEYATAYNEVKQLGGENSQDRTEDQTIAGIYWGYDGTPFLGTPPRLYNQIAAHISEQMGTRGIRLARLLALLNVAMADAGLVFNNSFRRQIFHRDP